MKQVVFISGKGGTGKSTIVTSLSLLVQNKLLADCDVEAPNLHLLIKGQVIEKKDYSGAQIAHIDLNRCISCDQCRQVCRFDAISQDYVVQNLSCEGCAACTVVCPQAAISLSPVKTGETFVTHTERGTFAHARLEIGAEGSGKLVTEVRKCLIPQKKQEDWFLIDGSPGIGCVVIASITGTDAVVVVAEPTPTGRHDLNRVLAVAAHFRIKAFVCINKFDLNLDVTQEIATDCMQQNIPVIGKIPFDPAIVTALQNNQTPVEAHIEAVVKPIRAMWEQLVMLLN
ncbi:MAG: ATP-binding protein [Eubacteriales bacterium]|nr:ATP-binding protein [Eubacteriales bacterium]